MNVVPSPRIIIVAVVLGLLLSVSVAYGDTVYLTNGRAINAESTAVKEVDGDPRTVQIPKGKTRLLFSNGGYQDIITRKIESIEKNDEDSFNNEETP